MKNKMQEIVQTLGFAGLLIYLVLFFLTFFGFWCLLSMGIDLKSWSFFSDLSIIEDVGIVGLAYAATKITQPLRIVLTIGIASLFIKKSGTENRKDVEEPSEEAQGDKDE